MLSSGVAYHAAAGTARTRAVPSSSAAAPCCASRNQPTSGPPSIALLSVDSESSLT
jgi:hypothetical protein